MASDNRRRFYQLAYEYTGEPIFFDDAGNLLLISGVLLQGMGTTVVFEAPNADQRGHGGIKFIHPTLEEWCEFLRISDDPQIFIQDETGTIKTVHRKLEHAISGAVQQQIWMRDDLRCMFCGKKMGQVQLTIDHFMPIELGGSGTQDNLLSACRLCQKRKGSQHPQAYCAGESLDYQGLCDYLAGKCSLGFIAHLNK